ncbi:leucine-rich repeat neuronal protein 3-like isoform X2 [Tigriopus californicus]|uniref:leucine-rich repeat neuronal protein 3-like isoform X2 n=1 Tax=Tigriopus californicus TaxID=6832 RepID=UPI0027D9F97A|nr:leucine-rich repeat neuronal protein 3-like isoform X2 [Tigriopus californicus]
MRQIWFFLSLCLAVCSSQDESGRDSSVCISNNPLRIKCECEPHGSVNCQHKSIHNIDEQLHIPDDTTFLDLSRNEIITVPSNLFSNVNNLKELYLSRNLIGKISSNAWFGALAELELLDLSHNRLSELTSTTFQGLIRLRTLNLGNNYFTTLPAYVFIPVPNLEVLDISSTHGIDALEPDSLVNCKQLTSLNLANCSIEHLPPNFFKDTHSLNSLSLANNSFDQIPNEELSLIRSTLTVLDLSGLHITDIHNHDFFGFHALRMLKINQMPFLERVEVLAFSSLTSLQRLDMQDNPHLHYIDPQAFYRTIDGQLKNTPKEIYLANNNLTFISGSMFYPWEIDVLDLSGNPLECDCNLEWINHLPEVIDNIDSLICHGPAELKDEPVVMMSVINRDCAEEQTLREI